MTMSRIDLDALRAIEKIQGKQFTETVRCYAVDSPVPLPVIPKPIDTTFARMLFHLMDSHGWDIDRCQLLIDHPYRYRAEYDYFAENGEFGPFTI